MFSLVVKKNLALNIFGKLAKIFLLRNSKLVDNIIESEPDLNMEKLMRRPLIKKC